MLKVASFDIVFQEIPGEVTLALNLSGCPCHCPGCHSQHLWEDIGEPLDEELLDGLLDRYGSQITCVCFMGGDQDPESVFQLADYVAARGLKVAWYSGRMEFPENNKTLTYLKLGPYIEHLGGLKSPTTNQRFYRREAGEWIECTSLFQKSTFAE
ncbi:MAG: anaerobic ribonucleoside-triphosphate reductase activating protein [Paludibacteraceae bacterium]|nr:anaerobic ribonucleoside-triphosphate reductase activating protein [Paludibacteraceae bacterium]